MRSKKKYLIDGRFLNSMTTGIDRYAYQLLACLDKVCRGSDIAILVPANAKEIPAYKNIRVIVENGHAFGHSWYLARMHGCTAGYRSICAMKLRCLHRRALSVCTMSVMRNLKKCIRF